MISNDRLKVLGLDRSKLEEFIFKSGGIWLGTYLVSTIAFLRTVSSNESTRILFDNKQGLFVSILSGLVNPYSLLTLGLVTAVCWSEIKFKGVRSWLIPVLLLPLALCWNLLFVSQALWHQLSTTDSLKILALSAGLKAFTGVGLFFGIAWIYRQKPLTTAVDSD